MAHCEYVSVAIALMYALLVGRLLTGMAPAFERGRRYSVHAAWVVVLLLVAVMSWWVFWRTNQVTWTPIRFLWALAFPGLVFVRAGILLGARPDEVTSFRDHFFTNRVIFFSLGVVAGLHVALGPWVLGVEPWLQLAPIHPTSLVLMLLSIAGLLLKSPRAHAVLVGLSLLLVLSTFLLVPSPDPAA